MRYYSYVQIILSTTVGSRTVLYPACRGTYILFLRSRYRCYKRVSMKLNKVFLKRRLKYKCDNDPKKGRLQDLSDRPHRQLPSTTAALAPHCRAKHPAPAPDRHRRARTRSKSRSGRRMTRMRRRRMKSSRRRTSSKRTMRTSNRRKRRRRSRRTRSRVTVLSSSRRRRVRRTHCRVGGRRVGVERQ